MSRVDELRAQYATMAENMPGEMKQMFQGILMGIDLAAGAAAQDHVTTLEGIIAKGSGNGDQPAWRRQASATGRTRNMEQPVTVYGLTDPRTPNGDIFYVGSSTDPANQLQDYIRSEDMTIGCKPMIESIIGDGLRPGIEVLEKDVKLADANSVKEKWMREVEGRGLTLTNKRR